MRNVAKPLINMLYIIRQQFFNFFNDGSVGRIAAETAGDGEDFYVFVLHR